MSVAVTSLAAVPVLRRGVRRQYDTARGAAVLLAPERVIVLDEIADAIVAECRDGHSVQVIAASLAARFDAPLAQVETDVIAFIEDLVERGLVSL